jgi:hypothetical protein
LFDSGNTPAASGQIDVLSDWRTKMGILKNLPDMTIVRTRGVITFAQPAAQALTYQTTFVPGLIVAPLSTTPTTALPDPVNTLDSEWLYWEGLTPFMNNSGGASASLASDFISSVRMDTKAQRKLKNIDDSLWFMWNGSPGTTWKVRASLAIGMKLP